MTYADDAAMKLNLEMVARAYDPERLPGIDLLDQPTELALELRQPPVAQLGRLLQFAGALRPFGIRAHALVGEPDPDHVLRAGSSRPIAGEAVQIDGENRLIAGGRPISSEAGRVAAAPAEQLYALTAATP